MAKAGFWMRGAKGKLAGATYYQSKGSTLMREVVTPGNPKSQAQMIQRARFFNAVKFYKHAVQALFAFAFEDKKKGESDYNAFMRHNARLGAVVDYEPAHNQYYPSVGNFVLSVGTLPEARVISNVDGGLATQRLFLPFDVENGITTIGELSQAILAYNEAYMVGDIVTIVGIKAQLNGVGRQPVGRIDFPKWDIVQFSINPENTELLSSLNKGNIALQYNGDKIEIMNVANLCAGAACIISRKTPAGLKCSNSILVGNATAEAYIGWVSDPTRIESAASTWGAKAEAILKGALLPEEQEPKAPDFEIYEDAACTIRPTAGKSYLNLYVKALVGYDFDAHADSVNMGNYPSILRLETSSSCRVKFQAPNVSTEYVFTKELETRTISAGDVINVKVAGDQPKILEATIFDYNLPA